MKYDLERFRKKYHEDFDTAYSEILTGKKLSHWMWWIFPQLRGLGHSDYANYYGISGISEAKAFLEDPELRDYLLKITKAVYKTISNNEDITIIDVFDKVDAMKLKSSMTLFAIADPNEELFVDVLKLCNPSCYSSFGDTKTIEMLGPNIELPEGIINLNAMWNRRSGIVRMAVKEAIEKGYFSIASCTVIQGKGHSYRESLRLWLLEHEIIEDYDEKTHHCKILVKSLEEFDQKFK